MLDHREHQVDACPGRKGTEGDAERLTLRQLSFVAGDRRSLVTRAIRLRSLLVPPGLTQHVAYHAVCARDPGMIPEPLECLDGLSSQAQRFLWVERSWSAPERNLPLVQAQSPLERFVLLPLGGLQSGDDDLLRPVEISALEERDPEAPEDCNPAVIPVVEQPERPVQQARCRRHVVEIEGSAAGGGEAVGRSRGELGGLLVVDPELRAVAVRGLQVIAGRLVDL
jgi:hypothetical protein